jgi:N-methylhydantoinase B
MMKQGNPASTAVDPITLEIVSHALQSIPDLVESDLMRTAYSPLIYEYKDYAVGIVDARGRSIALARQGAPLFIADIIGVAVRDGLAVHGETGIEPGDVLISNHAGTMGQHLNNVAMYVPIFSRSGELVAFSAVIAHWIDIGGAYPGSSSGTDTTELLQEGIQFRSVKLVRRAEPVRDVYQIIESNSRFPEMLLGDVDAQLAGCLKGQSLFENVLDKYGLNDVFSCIEEIWKKSEAAARADVEAIPDGTYRMESFLDDDGVDLDRPIRLPLTVRIAGSRFIVDFSEITEQVRGPFNSGRFGGAFTAARIAFKYLVRPGDPANEGSFAPVEIVLPDGKFLSASANAPYARYSTPLPTVIDTIIAAMAPALPSRVAAGHYGGFAIHGFSGTSPWTGRLFNVFDTGHGGWGGSAQRDGAGPYKSLIHGDNKDIPVEVQEALYPLLIEEYAWRADSAGAGKHRGGLGTTKVIRVLAPCVASFAFERYGCPAWGLFGGKSGAPGYVELIRKDQPGKRMLKTSELPLIDGDRLVLRTGGGGGYGETSERTLDDIASDLNAGFITLANATETYPRQIEEMNIKNP